MSEKELLNLYIEQDIDFYNKLTIPEQVLYKMQIRDTISFKKFCIRYLLNELKSSIIDSIFRKLEVEK